MKRRQASLHDQVTPLYCCLLDEVITVMKFVDDYPQYIKVY